MSPPKISASCSVTASGIPAASAAPNSEERISPLANRHWMSTGSASVVPTSRPSSRRMRSSSPPAVAKRSSQQRSGGVGLDLQRAARAELVERSRRGVLRR